MRSDNMLGNWWSNMYRRYAYSLSTRVYPLPLTLLLSVCSQAFVLYQGTSELHVSLESMIVAKHLRQGVLNDVHVVINQPLFLLAFILH